MFNNTLLQFIAKSKVESEKYKSLEFNKINNQIQQKYDRLLRTLSKGKMHIIKDLNLTVKMGMKRKRSEGISYHL